MKLKKASRILGLLLCVCCVGLSADDRTENIDVFVVLDKSLSMEEEIAAVRNYLRDTIVDEIVIPGDQLVLITFYGQAETLYAGTVSEQPIDVYSLVGGIRADGRFTDIGNALDALKRALPERRNEDRRSYLLLITDGKQEAPPGSRYYSTEEAFNHEFLQNAKEIRMEGWKIHILGVGAASAAREIASELSGTYTEVPEEPTEEELAETTRELLGVVSVEGAVLMRPVRDDGSSRLRFSLTSSGYEDTQRITVEAVTLEYSDGQSSSILPDASTLEIDPESTAEFDLPVSIDARLEPGSYEAVLTFVFDGERSFTPGSTRVSFRVKSFLGNNIWLIPVAVLVLAGLVAGVVFLAKRSGSIAFTCEIEDGPARKRAYKLKYGGTLYLIDGVMGFNLLPHAGQTPAGEITADRDGLHFSVRDEKQCTVDSIPNNLLGQRLEIRKKSGKKAALVFEAG